MRWFLATMCGSTLELLPRWCSRNLWGVARDRANAPRSGSPGATNPPKQGQCVGMLVLLLGFSRGNCFWPLVGQEMGLSWPVVPLCLSALWSLRLNSHLLGKEIKKQRALRVLCHVSECKWNHCWTQHLGAFAAFCNHRVTFSLKVLHLASCLKDNEGMKMVQLWSALGCWQTSCMLCREDEGECRPPGMGLQCEHGYSISPALLTFSYCRGSCNPRTWWGGEKEKGGWDLQTRQF